jgi:hypothetical protein
MAYIVDELGKVIDRKTNSNLFMPKPPPTGVYKPPSTPTATRTTAATQPAQTVTPPVTPAMPAATPQIAPQRNAEDYINDAARLRQESIEFGLKSAYDQNVGAINDAKAKLPAAYDTARNAAASQDAVQRQNFNEYAAASGLNSGAGGQAQLAFSNTLQGRLGALNTEQANKTADYDRQLSQLTINHKNAIAQALKEGEYEKAKNLFANFKTEQSALLEQQRYDTETSYSRAAAAASASGVYDGMAAFGWTPQQIAAANSGTNSGSVSKSSTPSYTPPAVPNTAPDVKDTPDMGATGMVTNDTPSGGTGFISVPGYGRLSWSELLVLVEKGKITETYNPDTGKYTYKKV